MAPLNFVIPSNFTLTVGGVDFTKCVAALSIQRPLPEPRTPQTWTGSITLTTPINPAYIPESLDPAINPNSRWEIGCYQILLQFGSTRLCPPLYVLGYRWNDQTRTAEIEVGDDLTLRNDFTAAQDYSRMGFSATSGATVAGLVERACQSVGLSSSVAGLAGSIPVAPDKNEGSWIEWAQSHAGERGYWLYMHTDGQVRVRNYPFSNTPVLLTRARSQVETWDPIFVDTPKEIYTCSGSGERLVPSDNPATTTVDEEYGDITWVIAGTNPPQQAITTTLTSRTTTTITQSGQTFYRKTVTTERCLGDLESQYYPGDTSLITYSVDEETHNARSGGEVYQIVRTIQMPLPAISTAMSEALTEALIASGTKEAQMPGAKLPYWRSFASVPIQIIETFEDGGIFSPTKGIVVTRTKNTYGYRRTNKTDYVSNLLVEAESETYTRDRIVISSADNPPTTHYTKRLSRSTRPESFRKTQIGSVAPTYIIRALNLAEVDTQTGQTPPSFPTLQAPYETGSVQFSGTATFTPQSASPFYRREEQLSADTLASGAECQQYARLVGTLAHQSYRGRSTNLPIPSEWLADPKPFQVVAIHDGLFITTNDQITLSNDGIELSWQLYRIGYLSTPVPEEVWTPAAPTVPYVVATPITRTGATPTISWEVSVGSWLRGSAKTRTGTTPIITWSVPTGRYVKRRTGTTPTITWSAAAGTYTTREFRTGTTPTITWSAPAGTYAIRRNRTGATPVITWSAPVGDWRTTSRTGATPTITWSAPAGSFVKQRTGTTPTINWTANWTGPLELQKLSYTPTDEPPGSLTYFFDSSSNLTKLNDGNVHPFQYGLMANQGNVVIKLTLSSSAAIKQIRVFPGQFNGTFNVPKRLRVYTDSALSDLIGTYTITEALDWTTISTLSDSGFNTARSIYYFRFDDTGSSFASVYELEIYDYRTGGGSFAKGRTGTTPTITWSAAAGTFAN